MLVCLDFIHAITAILPPFVAKVWHMYRLISKSPVVSAGFNSINWPIIPNVLSAIDAEVTRATPIVYFRSSASMVLTESPTFATMSFRRAGVMLNFWLQ